MEILYTNLFNHGTHGEYQDGAFEGAYELGGVRNAIYADAEEWVSKNYPYLITPF